jgi:hypothetical protein
MAIEAGLVHYSKKRRQKEIVGEYLSHRVHDALLRLTLLIEGEVLV